MYTSYKKQQAIWERERAKIKSKRKKNEWMKMKYEATKNDQLPSIDKNFL